MTAILKQATRLFAALCVALVATAALAVGLDAAGVDLDRNVPLSVLGGSVWPAVMVRRSLDDLPQEGYVYLSALGLADVLGLAGLYFALCLLCAWLWAVARRRA